MLSAEAKARKKETSRLRYLRDRERILAQQRAYKQAHPEVVAAQDARRYHKDIEASRAKGRARNAQRSDYMREYNARYRQENADYYRMKCAERRARQADGDLTLDQWWLILEEFDFRCAYCQVAGERLEIEHMTALARGGRHVASNVVPACRSCNAAKGKRSIFEFLAIV